jgi:hypothetical protein
MTLPAVGGSLEDVSWRLLTQARVPHLLLRGWTALKGIMPRQAARLRVDHADLLAAQ